MRALWDRAWMRVGAALVAGALVGGVIFFVTRSGSEIVLPPEQSVQVHTGAEESERPHIDAVRSLLNALPTTLAAGSTAALTEPLAGAGPQLAQLWPVGARTTVDPATWARTGEIASVQVEVTTESTTTKALVTLSFEEGKWRLLNVEGLPQ